MDFINIPQQIFQMGSSEDDPDALYFETPKQEIETSCFEISENPISNEDWLKFINESGYNRTENNYLTHWKNNKGNVNPKDPVLFISYEDASSFCKFYHYKLPTEAQWEAASNYMGKRIMGLWQWCRDPWNEFYFQQLQDITKSQGYRIKNPLMISPDLSKIPLLDQDRVKLATYLSSFGVVRGCGEEWLRFGQSMRFPLKHTPQRRAQIPKIARHHCLGARVAYEENITIQRIITDWEDVLF